MNWKNIAKTLGPGILFASTAIGVSHLVQSTRAGADFGFTLIWAILAANIFKYPFFEFGSRYANVAGESLIDGYKRIGKWMLFTYFILTIVSMVLVTSAVGAVTAGFLDNLFGVKVWLGDYSTYYTTVFLFLVCISILLFGRFQVLDKLIKIIGVVLLISTLVAFVLTLFNHSSEVITAPAGFSMKDTGHVAFLIALMGWMPTAVDLSAWNSLWTIARIKQSGYHPKLKETLFDFNFGYFASAILSICFLTLGALLLHGSGNELSNNGAVFANQVVGMYTKTIGQWSYLIIAAAAFSIMFGTCIAVFDGYSRSFQRSWELLTNQTQEDQKKWYTTGMILTGVLALVLITFVTFTDHSFKFIVDWATRISFLIAPIIAIVNFKLVTSNKYMNKEAQPTAWLKVLSYLGIIFLTGFSGFYLYTIFFA